jgi:hypothetical protein
MERCLELASWEVDKLTAASCGLLLPPTLRLACHRLFLRLITLID